MADLSMLGILTAFTAGVVSFLSPCVLPLVPGYLSYIAGRSLDPRTGGGAASLSLPALGLSLCFVLGFSTVFILLGASATALGRLLLAWRYELNIVGGAIVILFGLFMTGLLRPFWMMRDLRLEASPKSGDPAGAYLLGLAFGFGWTPCIGPVLGAILTVSATSVGIAEGVSLLAAYALGLGLPFLAAAAFTGGFVARLGTMRRLGRLLQIGAGAVMVAMGIAMITGDLSRFSYWLLDAFPALATIG